MLFKVPIYCYGKEQTYDHEYFYARIKFTSGNSIKFEHIDGCISFYIQKGIPSKMEYILRHLARTQPVHRVGYNHTERKITILDIEINEDLDATNGLDLTVPADKIYHSATTNVDQTSKKEEEKKKGEKIMNLQLKDKLYYGEAPRYFGVSFDGRITFDGKAYNPEEKALIDTLGLTIKVPLFILPQTAVEAGDVVYVPGQEDTALYYDGTSFIDYRNGQVSNYVPTKIFNMSFYSVVKNPLAGSFNGQNQMNNLLPLLLMKDGNKDNDDLFLMMAMCNGGLGNLFGGSQKPTNKTE